MELKNTDYKLIYNKTQGDPNHPWIQKLLKNVKYSYHFAFYLIKNNKEIPDVIVQGIAKNSAYSYLFAKDLIKNKKEVKEIPEIIVQGIAKDSAYSFSFATFLIENKKEVPDIIVQSIAEYSFDSYSFAEFLIKNKKEVPENIVQGFAEDSYYSYDFAKLLIQNNKEVPDIIKKSARQFKDDLPELKESKFYKLYNSIMLEKVKVTKKDKERVNKKTLEKGAKVEKEHTDSKKKAEHIAIQHIKEFPTKDTPTKLDSDYYKHLDKMEKELTKALKEVNKKRKGKK